MIPLRVEPGAPSIVLPRPELLLTAALITDANCRVSVTLEGQELCVCPVLH